MSVLFIYTVLDSHKDVSDVDCVMMILMMAYHDVDCDYYFHSDGL